MQTCSLHACEEGVLLVGDGPDWTVVVEHPLQERGVVLFFAPSENEAFSGLDQPRSCSHRAQTSKICSIKRGQSLDFT